MTRRPLHDPGGDGDLMAAILLAAFITAVVLYVLLAG
jgi:hypothetical protein